MAASSACSSMSNSAHQWWNPQSSETADHSIPYGVAAALLDGTVTMHSFDDAHLQNPDLRTLLRKTEVVENDEFTAAYEGHPIQHRARVTVTVSSGERLVGESGGENGELSTSWSDDKITSKFRGLTEDILGAKRVSGILDRLWNLENLNNVAAIPPDFVLE